MLAPSNLIILHISTFVKALKCKFMFCLHFLGKKTNCFVVFCALRINYLSMSIIKLKYIKDGENNDKGMPEKNDNDTRGFGFYV